VTLASTLVTPSRVIDDVSTSLSLDNQKFQCCNAALCLLFRVWVVFMREIVDRVMVAVKPISVLSEAELRSKVGGYLELLTSTGKRDPGELATLAAAYLRDIVDGPDPRFTGC
jgi:hypothetical protein